MVPDSCALLNSFGVACVGPSASLVFGGAGGGSGLIAASEGGIALGGVATELLAEVEEAPVVDALDATGLGASVCFWQAVRNIGTAIAATRTPILVSIVTSHEMVVVDECYCFDCRSKAEFFSAQQSHRCLIQSMGG
jgi:hypothetical protein